MTVRATYKRVSEALKVISGDETFAQRVEERLQSRRIIKSLIARRVSRGLSQSQIARELGCTQSRVSKIENGFDAELKLEELEAYAKALGCDVTLQFARREERPDSDEPYLHIDERDESNRGDRMASVGRPDQSVSR